MKRGIVSLVVALALVIGLNTAPASAHPMGWGQTSHDVTVNCEMWSTYTNYGGNGIAQVAMTPNTSCSTFSGVSITTAFGQGVETKWCFADQAIFAPTSFCYAIINSLTIALVVVWPGTALRMDAYACSVAVCGHHEHWIAF